MYVHKSFQFLPLFQKKGNNPTKLFTCSRSDWHNGADQYLLWYCTDQKTCWYPSLCLCFFFWWEVWAFLLWVNLSLSFTKCWLADLFTMRSAGHKQARLEPYSKWGTFGWIHAGSDDEEHENIVTVTKHEAFWSMTATAAGPTLFPFQKSIFQLLFWNVDGWLGWRTHYQDWAQTGMHQNCQNHEWFLTSLSGVKLIEEWPTGSSRL